MDVKEKKFKYFRYSEFKCPCCGRNETSIELIKMLDKAREKAKVKFIITSGYRCEKHNAFVKGSKNSSHLEGYAADILCVNPDTRYIILKSLILAGFDRIGIYEKHIHVDIDPRKPHGVVWLAKYK